MNKKEQFENGQHSTDGEPDILQVRLRQETEEGGRGDGAVASEAQPPANPPTIHITVAYGAEPPGGRWKRMVAGAAALVAFLSAFTTLIGESTGTRRSG